MAMQKAERMAEFMHHLLFEPANHEIFVARQAVELIRQPVRRDNGGGSAQLSFPEDEREHGNEKVHVHDSNALASHIERSVQDLREQLCGMSLATRRVVGCAQV